MNILKLTKPNGHQQLITLDLEEGAVWMVGRADFCKISVPEDTELAEKHCIITRVNDAIVIRDNMSPTGVTVGGTKILEEPMQPGRTYAIGNCTLCLERDTPAPKPPRGAAAKGKAPALATKRVGAAPTTQHQLHTADKDRQAYQGRPATEFGLPYEFALDLQMHTQDAVLTPGSVLKFKVNSPEECDVYLVQFDSMGNAYLLVPAEATEPAAHAPAGVDVMLPANADDELVVGLPLGQDLVVAIACGAPCNFAQEFNKTLETMGAAPNPGAALMQAISRCGPNRWAAAYVYITTQEG